MKNINEFVSEKIDVSTILGGVDKGAWVHTSGTMYNGKLAIEDTFFDTNDNGKLDESIEAEQKSFTIAASKNE